MMEWLESIDFRRVIAVLIVIAVFVALWILLRMLFHRWIKAEQKSGSKRGIASVLWDTVKLLLVILGIIVLLEVNGIDVTSAIAGLGIASAVVGLALQDILKDIIMGVHIAMDGFFKVGDYIYYQGELCRVRDFNLRTTKLENITKPGSFTLCNRLIESVERASEFVQLDIPVSYSVPQKLVDETLRRACARAERIEGVTRMDYTGLDKLGDSAMIYVIMLYCNQERRYYITREVMSVIKNEMDSAQVTVPFNQVDVHLDK